MMLQSAVTSMGEFGFTRAEVSAMVDAKIKLHTEATRHVLFPDERTMEGDSSQDAQTNTNSFEQLKSGGTQMNEAEMKAELERLRAENAQLKTKEKGGITLKVSEKGAISLYGMGKFPVTLYKEQWLPSSPAAPDRGIHPRERRETEDKGIETAFIRFVLEHVVRRETVAGGGGWTGKRDSRASSPN